MYNTWKRYIWLLHFYTIAVIVIVYILHSHCKMLWSTSCKLTRLNVCWKGIQGLSSLRFQGYTVYTLCSILGRQFGLFLVKWQALAQITLNICLDLVSLLEGKLIWARSQVPQAPLSRSSLLFNEPASNNFLLRDSLRKKKKKKKHWWHHGRYMIMAFPYFVALPASCKC